MNTPLESEVFDVGVIGAGPAGSGAVWRLKDSGLRIVWFDRSTFPRDKICGDAIPYETYAVLDRLEPGSADELRARGGSERIQKSRLFLPSGKGLEIRWKTLAVNSSRFDFDHWLVQKALLKNEDVQLEFGQKVRAIQREGAHFSVQTEQKTFNCTYLIGAGGAHCPLARMANLEIAARSSVRKPERAHKLAAVRAYARGIQGMEPGTNEVHAFKSILPGYFWIFSLPGQRANIGLGMLATDLARSKLDLKRVLTSIVTEGPLAERFEKAQIEVVQGFDLPLGSSGSARSGRAYFLCGDAASLIDPIDGHGIGTALHSGELAAEALVQIRNGGREEHIRKAYESRLDALYYRKHRLHRRLLYFAGNAFVLNSLGKASTLRALGMDVRAIES